MKKFMPIFVLLFVVSLLASCKKDLSPDPSVQRPDIERESPAGTTYASIKIKNNAANAYALIDSVYFMGYSLTGAAFPVERNTSIDAFTSYFGKQVLYVSVRGGLSSSVRIIDSENKVHKQDIAVSGPATLAFEDISIVEGGTIQILYVTSSFDY